MKDKWMILKSAKVASLSFIMGIIKCRPSPVKYENLDFDVDSWNPLFVSSDDCFERSQTISAKLYLKDNLSNSTIQWLDHLPLDTVFLHCSLLKSHNSENKNWKRTWYIFCIVTVSWKWPIDDCFCFYKNSSVCNVMGVASNYVSITVFIVRFHEILVIIALYIKTDNQWLPSSSST